MNKPVKIEISHRTIVFTAMFLTSMWLIYQIRDVVLGFFVAMLLMFILNPIVVKLSKYKIPRFASVLIVYFLMFVLVGSTFAMLIPPFIDQWSSFVVGLPRYLENVGVLGIYSEQIIGQLISQMGAIPSQLARVVISIFSNALSIFTVLMFTFYLLMSRNKLDDQLGLFFGEERRKEIDGVLNLLEKRLGGWARGQLLLMFMIWISTYVGLLLLGIPFALPLSILAGLLEIVPYIGPIIAAVPVVIVGFGISPIVGMAAVALVFLVQQVENYLFVPKVMEKSAGVSPIITLLALAIGFRLAGIVGVLISVPLVVTIQALSGRYFLSKKPSKN